MNYKCKVLQTIKNKFDEKIRIFLSDSESYQEFIIKSLKYNKKFSVYTDENLCCLCHEWWNEYQAKYWEMNEDRDE
tara:strand:+ start:352 stop:579 length:228 start_codon:yes stop_codon:yes gene_type:complete